MFTHLYALAAQPQFEKQAAGTVDRLIDVLLLGKALVQSVFSIVFTATELRPEGVLPISKGEETK